MSLISQSLLGSLVAIFLLATAVSELPAFSKAWTVDQRQAKLMQDVNAGQKSGALTAQQSRKLRKGLANVARKKVKMTEKTHGKLNASDTAKLQTRIDKTSSKIKSETGQ